MKVLYLTVDKPEEWNSSEWRCVMPMKALNSLENSKAHILPLEYWAANSHGADEHSRWADVIVVQRNLVGQVFTAMEYWKTQGKTILLDIDDDYKNIPSDILTYQYWIAGHVIHPTTKKTITVKPAPIDQLIWAFKLVHGVTAPSEKIIEDWKYLNPNMMLLPNYLDIDRYKDLYREIETPTTIGWGGSLSHTRSFRKSGILTAINKLVERHNLKLVIIGSSDVYRRIALPPLKKKHIPWMPIKKWPKAMAENIDIGLAPLAGLYDEHRSWIKVLEYMAAGIPTVATDYEVYRPFKSYVHLIDNNQKAWEQAVLDIIANWREEKERAKENIAIVEQYGLIQNAPKILSVYEELQRRKDVSIRHFSNI